MESPFLVGDWLVEPGLNRVSGITKSKTLEPRTMRVLVELAQVAPRVVSRDELLASVWEDTVVTEHSLTIAISDLRKVFEDNPKAPAFIETIRGVGYRLIAPIRLDAEDQPAVELRGNLQMHHAKPEIAFPTPALSISRMGDGVAATGIEDLNSEWNFKRLVFPALMFITLAAATWVFLRSGHQDSFAIHRIQPLTTMAGAEISPAFSPDSRRVAFVAFPDSGGISEIFVQQVDAETPVRLTDEAGAELMPAWSPDGQFIAYLHFGPEECALFKKPSFGGASIKLKTVDCNLGGIAWSPAGEALVISAPDKQKMNRRLYKLDLQSMALSPITTPPPSHLGDISPRFSPDGSTLSFIRIVDGASKDIYLKPWPAESNPTRLTHDNVNITGFDWTADGRSIVFASARKENNALWRLQVGSNREPRLIRAVSVNDPGSVVLARSGSRLVYTDWTYEVNTWRFPVMLNSASAVDQEGQPALSSTRSDFHPDVSGHQKVAFISTRSGANEVWVSELDGQHPTRLTTLNSQATRFPAWSPDNRYIAFESRAEEQSDIYLIDAQGGVPQKVTDDAFRDTRPTWSNDGRYLYFGSDRSGDWQVWRISLEERKIEQVTKDGGLSGKESADGTAFYYVRPDTSGIWKKDLVGGKELLYVDADPSFFDLTDAGLYYLHQPENYIHLEVRRFDFAAKKSETIQKIPIKPLNYFARWGFAVSPEDQWIYVSQVDKSESDLMLTEGKL